MAEELNDEPQWELRVLVPMRRPVEERLALFDAVAHAVAEWEPDERDGWDADVTGCPERDRLSYRDSQLLLWLHAEAVHLNEWYLKTGRIQQRWVDEDRTEMDRLTAELKRVEASRQAWAEEAARLEMAIEYDNGILDDSPCPVEPDEDAPCSCLAEGVTLPAGWVRPQCAVHPEAGGE